MIGGRDGRREGGTEGGRDGGSSLCAETVLKRLIGGDEMMAHLIFLSTTETPNSDTISTMPK